MPTRRINEPDKPARRPTLYTCANCDAGWIPEAYEVTTWKADGKRHTRQIPVEYPLPSDYKAQDRRVKFYRAVRRCPCVKVEVLDQKQIEEVSMPKEISERKIGEIVKRMPDQGFWAVLIAAELLRGV